MPTQTQKKELEKTFGETLARALNATNNADYSADVDEVSEPSDCDLVSKSGSFPVMHAQIVTVPGKDSLDWRWNNDNLRTIRDRLTSALKKRGDNSGDICLLLTQKGLKFGFKTREIEQLADMIIEHRSRGRKLLTAEMIWKNSPELAALINDVILHDVSSDVPVQSTLGGFLPDATNWIKEAINNKVRHYGNLKDLILIVGATTVDRNQVDFQELRSTLANSGFKEVWLVCFSETFRIN